MKKCKKRIKLIRQYFLSDVQNYKTTRRLSHRPNWPSGRSELNFAVDSLTSTTGLAGAGGLIRVGKNKEAVEASRVRIRALRLLTDLRFPDTKPALGFHGPGTNLPCLVHSRGIDTWEGEEIEAEDVHVVEEGETVSGETRQGKTVLPSGRRSYFTFCRCAASQVHSSRIPFSQCSYPVTWNAASPQPRHARS